MKNKRKKDLYTEKDIKNKLDYIEDRIAYGITETELMKRLDVSRTTYYKWKESKKEFREAIERGKRGQIQVVENQLLKKILGYTVEETEERQDEHGNVLERKIKTKFINPDTTSMIFWLKNRNPDEWKDRIENNHTGSVEFNVKLEE